MAIEILEMTRPSDALQAMVDGLRAQDEREGFHVEMRSFFEFYPPSVTVGEAPACKACAATSALQEASGKIFDKRELINRNDRAAFTELQRETQFVIECALEVARQGYLKELFDLFDAADFHDPLYDKRFCLETDNWRSQLEDVEDLIDELEALDL